MKPAALRAGVLALAALPLAFAGGAAFALDTISVAAPAVMYDAPSRQATPLYIAATGTPMEVISKQSGWRKVREPGGKLAWIEESAVSAKRTVIVTADRAEVRARPDDAAPLVFEADKSVVLEQTGEAAPPGWVKVRHANGATGYVHLTQIWGY